MCNGNVYRLEKVEVAVQQILVIQKDIETEIRAMGVDSALFHHFTSK